MFKNKMFDYGLMGCSLLAPFLLCAAETATPPASTEEFFYPNPGIIAPRGNRWIGSDHLYNLPDAIGIAIEIHKQDGSDFPLTSESIRQIVADVFKKVGISVPAMKETSKELAKEVSKEASKPPLPSLHVLIMSQKIDKGYAIFCSARLFESVTVDRVRLSDQTYMQGITWESQNFTVASTADLERELRKSVTDLAQAFADRYQFFRNIKAEMQKN